MPIKFCAQCGTELTQQFIADRERPVCPKCGYVVYRNPIPVSLVVAAHDDHLLLVHRVHAPLAGYWAPPTGYVEMDESVEEAAVRETKEETGLDVVVTRLLKVYSRANMGVILIAFAAEIVGGQVSAGGEDVDAVRFFARDKLPRQAAPPNGQPLDVWFHEIIADVFKATLAPPGRQRG